jgi:hypothetical protein
MTTFHISYHEADRAWAEWIAWQLEAAGHSASIHLPAYRPEANFRDQIRKAISKAQCVIALLSPDYLASGVSNSDWQTALTQQMIEDQSRLIPFRVRPYDSRDLPKGML